MLRNFFVIVVTICVLTICVVAIGVGEREAAGLCRVPEQAANRARDRVRKVDALVQVTRTADDEFVLTTDAGFGDAVAGRLNRFKLRTKADVTVLDSEAMYKVDPDRFWSKSRNSPFRGWELRGRVTHTIVAGRVVHEVGHEEGGRG